MTQSLRSRLHPRYTFPSQFLLRDVDTHHPSLPTYVRHGARKELE